MWPGCDRAHAEQHRIGIPKFQERWVVDLAAECARREAEYLEEKPAGAKVADDATSRRATARRVS